MTNNRKEKIKEEAQRRLNLWLKHSTFEDMSCDGSKMRFDMSLGLSEGYPFDKPDWMKGQKFNSFVTESEFNSKEYDSIIYQLFYSQLDIIGNEKIFALDWLVAVLERDFKIDIRNTNAFTEAKARQRNQFEEWYESGYKEGLEERTEEDQRISNN